jgi:hypothetical protein
MLLISSATLSILATNPKKYDLDEQVIMYRLSKIQTAFDTALASNDIKKIILKLDHDIYNFFNLAFHEAKQNLANKDKMAAKQYLIILKETAQKIEAIFSTTSIDTDKLAGILFLCAFKIKSLTEAEPSLETCFSKLLSCKALAQPLSHIAQDTLLLLITLAENAKKNLTGEDIKFFKLAENIDAMKTIAKFFDGDFKKNLIKAQLWGPQISQKNIAEVLLFWTSLAPVYVTLEKQILEKNIAPILQHLIVMTDGFIAQVS